MHRLLPYPNIYVHFPVTTYYHLDKLYKFTSYKHWAYIFKILKIYQFIFIYTVKIAYVPSESFVEAPKK